jgi:hypothetical protein
MLSVCCGSCLSQVSFPYRRFEEIVLEEIVLDEEIDQDFKSENRSLVRSPTSEQVSILYAPDSSGAGYDDLVSVERQDKIMYKLVEVMFRARRGHSASGCSTELGIPDSSSDSSSFAGDDDVGSVELGDAVIKENAAIKIQDALRSHSLKKKVNAAIHSRREEKKQGITKLVKSVLKKDFSETTKNLVISILMMKTPVPKELVNFKTDVSTYREYEDASKNLEKSFPVMKPRKAVLFEFCYISLVDIFSEYMDPESAKKAATVGTQLIILTTPANDFAGKLKSEKITEVFAKIPFAIEFDLEAKRLVINHTKIQDLIKEITAINDDENLQKPENRDAVIQYFGRLVKILGKTVKTINDTATLNQKSIKKLNHALEELSGAANSDLRLCQGEGDDADWDKRKHNMMILVFQALAEIYSGKELDDDSWSKMCSVARLANDLATWKREARAGEVNALTRYLENMEISDGEMKKITDHIYRLVQVQDDYIQSMKDIRLLIQDIVKQTNDTEQIEKLVKYYISLYEQFEAPQRIQEKLDSEIQAIQANSGGNKFILTKLPELYRAMAVLSELNKAAGAV